MKRIVTVLLLVIATMFVLIRSLPIEAQNGEGAVYRVYYEDDAAIDPFLNFDIWHDRIPQGSFLVYLTPEQYASIADLPLHIEVDAEQTATLAVERIDRGGGIPGFPCYRTVEETYSSFADLAAANPTLVEIVDIGDSYEKATAGGLPGYDLNAYIITNQNSTPTQPKPVFLILAAVHAREYTTAETATRLVESLVNGYGTDPNATWLLDYYELHVIPQGNPDGRKIAEGGVSWRKNRNPSYCGSSNIGVDLNRNASYQWGGSGSSGSACDNRYRGPSPASEIETMAFEAYAASVLPDQRADTLTATAPITTSGMFVTLHSFDPSILPAWAWTSYDDNPNFEGHNAIGRKMAFFNNYEVYGTGGGFSAADGTHDDYVYGTLGVPSFTFEMGTTFFQSCSSFETTIYPSNKLALEYAFKATRLPYQQAFGPDLTNLTLNAAITTSVTVTQGNSFTLTAFADDTRYRYNTSVPQAGFGINEFVANQAISSVSVYLDQPSWETPISTYVLTATDGAFDSVTETVGGQLSTNGWTVGQHIVFIEATDTAGETGIPSAIFVDVLESPTPTRVYLPIVAKNASAASRQRAMRLGTVLLAHIGLSTLTTVTTVNFKARQDG